MQNTRIRLSCSPLRGVLLFMLLLFATISAHVVEGVTPTEGERAALGISGFRLASLRNGAWRVQTVQGDSRGILINTRPFAEKVKGFQGPTPLFVLFDNNGTVTAVVAKANSEASDYFARARSVLDAFVGMTAATADEAMPDAVSGATYSSRALIENMQAACKAYRQVTKKQDIMGQVGSVMLVLALVAGVVIVFWHRRKRGPACCRR